MRPESESNLDVLFALVLSLIWFKSEMSLSLAFDIVKCLNYSTVNTCFRVFAC